MNLNKFLEVAREAAMQAGVVLKKHFRKLDPSMINEKDKNDYVTDVDRRSEEIIKSHIKSHFNNHDILAEESLVEKHFSPFLWIIDPLDGTLNYIHGLPSFAVSIALEIEGELTVGLIYEPLRESIYSTIKGRGAFKNGKRIHVSRAETLNTSLIATGFPFRIKDIIDPYLKVFRELSCVPLALEGEGRHVLTLHTRQRASLVVFLNVHCRHGTWLQALFWSKRQVAWSQTLKATTSI